MQNFIKNDCWLSFEMLYIIKECSWKSKRKMSSLLVIPISSPLPFSPLGMKPTTCPVTISSLPQPTDPSHHLQFQWLTWFLYTWGARQAARSAGAHVCCCTNEGDTHHVYSCLSSYAAILYRLIFYLTVSFCSCLLSLIPVITVNHSAVICSLELRLPVA